MEEGETGGAVGAVPKAAIRKAGRVATISATASTLHPWIIATARLWLAEITMDRARGAIGRVLRRIIRKLNPSHCLCARTQHRASSVL